MINLKSDFFYTILKNLNIEIVSHGHLYADREWNYSIHSVPNNRLYFVLDGKAHIENEHHKVALESGNVYLIPLNSPYKLCCEGYMEKLYVHFNAEILPGHDLFQDNNICLFKNYDKALIKKLVSKFNSDKISDAIFCKSIVMEAIGEFIELSKDKTEEWFNILIKYEKVYSYIKNNCNANITVRQLADEMNMTPAALSKNFKNDMGYTLKSYLNHKIIEKIKQMLLLTDSSIKGIAGELGFCDEFYLSNFFKKQVGISPKEYKSWNKIIKERSPL